MSEFWRFVTGNTEETRSPHAPIKRALGSGVDCHSRAECLEIICTAASMGIGECPVWVILALERSELPDFGLENGRQAC